ncbi:hypothetical protein IQ263_24220 [Tychonema sp. LEGE 06208]|nr:hypothetical protein [Tychonema sp. LEGE 06208]
MLRRFRDYSEVKNLKPINSASCRELASVG